MATKKFRSGLSLKENMILLAFSAMVTAIADIFINRKRKCKDCNKGGPDGRS